MTYEYLPTEDEKVYGIPDRHGSPTTLPLPFTIEKSTNKGTLFYDSPNLKRNPWFHGRMARTEAEKMLGGTLSGTFLVRERESNPGEYALSLSCDGHLVHYRIKTDADKTKYYITEHFESLQELVNHHSKSSDGLETTLRYPAPKTGVPTLPSEPAYKGTSEVDEWELSRSELHMGSKAGGGQYGDVYKAVIKDSGEIVAVKVFKVSDGGCFCD